VICSKGHFFFLHSSERHSGKAREAGESQNPETLIAAGAGGRLFRLLCYLTWFMMICRLSSCSCLLDRAAYSD
jgi:organic hydroperoxide reductase OsmC/OhrA